MAKPYVIGYIEWMATVRLVRTPEEALGLIAKLCSWVNVLPPRNVEWAVNYQFWLGASADFDCCVLFAFPYNDIKPEPSAENALAWLENANEKNASTVGRILLEAYVTSRRRDSLVAIQPIEVEIPEASTVATIGAFFPGYWSQWPASLELSFELSEGQGVNASLYNEYKCETIEDALRVVMKPRVSGLLIRYSLVAELDAVPLLPYIVDRSLFGGKRISPERRPRNDYARLIELYQHVRRRVGFGREPAYYDEHTVRLAVSGKTAEEAERNWSAIAKELRYLRRAALRS